MQKAASLTGAAFLLCRCHAGGPHAERGVLAQDGNAVETSALGARPAGVIPAYHVGQGLAPQLRLLEAQHVGPLAQQRLQAPVLHAGGASVHVPGDDPHAGKGRALPAKKQISMSKNLTARPAPGARPFGRRSDLPSTVRHTIDEEGWCIYSNGGTLKN